ncbi:hypothetical protein HDE_04117 [Halotydeus destructor]|nr:hypothetical protein HDE_04117 [Halotydeus destructor]
MGDSGFSAAEAAGHELWKNAFLNFTVDNVDVFLFQWNPDSASILELESNGTALQSRMSKIHSTFDDVQAQFDKLVSSTTAYLLQLQGDKSTLSQEITALEASFKSKQATNSELSEAVANKTQEHAVCSKQMSDHLETKKTLDSTTLQLYVFLGEYALIKHECNRNYTDVSQENARLSAELSSLEDSLKVENERQKEIMKVLLEEFTNGLI